LTESTAAGLGLAFPETGSRRSWLRGRTIFWMGSHHQGPGVGGTVNGGHKCRIWRSLWWGGRRVCKLCGVFVAKEGKFLTED
jgi:hypothetical protein